MKAQRIELIDAEEMHKKSPDSFWAPSLDPEHREALDALELGDFIKVCNGQERFWCVIVALPERGKFVATVDNVLLCSDLEYGDRIEVEERHLYTYMSKREEAAR
jgi:hypothetical protein